MPGFGGNAGFLPLFLGVPFNEAVPGRHFPESPAHPVIREIGADEIDGIRAQGQVHRQTGLVFTAPRAGHIPGGEILALLGQGIVPDGLLFVLTAPARYRQDLPLPVYRFNGRRQHAGGGAVQVLVRPAALQRHQIGDQLPLQRMFPVHQDQAAFAGSRCRQAQIGKAHPRTPSSTRRSSSAGKLYPTSRIMAGNRLWKVSPGMVFTSLKTIRPSGVRNMSTRAKPRQPSAS